MNNINLPLSEAEFDLLGDFLLDRIDEDADTADRDAGVINVSELDGLLTAVVSGPTMVPPSQWLPAVWGDFEPAWQTEAEFGRIFGLLVRHMNSISDLLMNQPFDFEPLFMAGHFEGGSTTIVDDWCEGYMRGVALAPGSWHADDDEVWKLLSYIAAFTSVTDWEAHAEESHSAVEALQAKVPGAARQLHAFWLARRTPAAPPPAPFRHRGPPAGRNDPCPCGSGKKYKKCCLQ